MDRLQQRSELGDIEPRSRRGNDAECPPRDLAAEGEPLDVEEARGALQVGKRRRIGALQPFESRPRRELEAEHVEECHIVALQDPEEGRDILRPVVDYLGRRPSIAAEEHPAHPDERFRIGGVRRRADQRYQPPRKVALAADVACCRADRRHHLQAICTTAERTRLFHFVLTMFRSTRRRVGGIGPMQVRSGDGG